MSIRSQVEIDVIIGNGQNTLGNLAFSYVNRKKSGVAYPPDLKDDTYRLILLDHYLRAVIDPDTEDVYDYLLLPSNDTKLNKLLDGIYKLSDIFDIPGVPITGRRRLPLIFEAVGQPGNQGLPGLDGSDAFIDVIGDPTYDNIAVSSTLILGVKTFKLGYSPYVAAQAFIAIQGSKVREIGVIIGSLTIIVGSIKGRETITRREIVAPGGIVLSNPNLNDPGLQQENVLQSNVSVTTEYDLEVEDDRTISTASDTITFVYPFLYGNSSTAVPSPNYYQGLTKLVATKSTKQVTFNGVNQYFMFGYVATYGSLTRILDQNGFDVTGSFDEISVSVTSFGLDSNWSSVTFKFYRTKVLTTINNGLYTFQF